ncbi:MAG: DUF3426 domain-containing protein [Burkholderiales bacterium]
MALATTCPRCQTGFRVVPDQLKIRRGLVRCGACRHVFSGLDSLRYVNEQTDLAVAPPPQAPALAGPVDQAVPDGAPDARKAPSAADAISAPTVSAPASPPPGAALSAERLAATYGRGEPDIADALFDEPEPTPPAAASHHEPGRHESAFDDTEPDNNASDNDTSDHSAPVGILDEGVLDEDIPHNGVLHGASLHDDALPDGAADTATAGEQAALAEAARRRRAPAVDLDRPTDLVVLEGLEELDDLDTLNLPDYLSEPAVPAEPPADLPLADETKDTLSGDRPPSPGPVAADKAPASIIGKHALEHASAADDAAPTPSLAGLPAPADGAAEPESTNNAMPSAPVTRGPGDAPEAWSAALLAPDPATRRARSGDTGGPEAVDFFATAARAGGFASRRTLFSAVLCMVLSVTLVLQMTLAGRDWLASRVPALEPALVALSGLIGLRVQAPRELDSLTLESFDVQAGASADALVMDLLMRNRAAHAVRWPAIEMSLADAAGVLLVRKVVLPADYLGPNLPPAGAPPDQETALRLALQVTGFAPAGFSLKLFYP